MNDRDHTITVDEGPGPGTYNVGSGYGLESVSLTAQGLLNLGQWIEEHRDQLEQEASASIPMYVEPNYKCIAEGCTVRVTSSQREANDGYCDQHKHQAEESFYE